MARQKTLYDQAVEVTQEFLGPAGERFLSRQIVTHLNIQPEELASKHIPGLVAWVRLTFAVLTKEADHVEEFSDRLMALARTKSRSSRLSKVGSDQTR